MSVSLLTPQSLWFLPTHQLLLCNAVLRDKTVSKPSYFSMWKTSVFSFILVYFQRGLRKTSLLFLLALKNISRLCVHICVLLVHVQVHMCLLAHGDQRLDSGVLLQVLSTWVLRQGLSWAWKLSRLG